MAKYITYDELFRAAIHEFFAPQNLGLLLLERKLNELGIMLTEDLRASIRAQLENPGPSLFLDIDDELTEAGFEPDENGKVNLTIDLTDEIEWLDKLESDLPELLDELIPTLSRRWALEQLQRLNGKSSTILKTEYKAQKKFRAVLRNVWGEALDCLELFLILATEAGSDFANEYKPPEGEEPDYVFRALVGLHARACQIGKEVHTLLEAGFADGAHARWRTLHELSVIASFISKKGQETAERYLLHDIIESRKAAHQHVEYASRINEPPPTAEDIALLDEQYASLVERFGKEFRKQYGWAADVLSGRAPNFAEIERATGLDHFRPYYRLASHNIHANPKGIAFRLGSVPGNDLLLAGASIYGLSDPGHGTTISLLQITTWLLTHEPTIDRLVRLYTLMDLEYKIGELFSNAQSKLESGLEDNTSNE